METIINLTLLGIVIICAWSGYKKGIVMGVGGIVAIIVSLYGARLMADTFSMEVVPALRPFANGYMEAQLRAEDGVLAELGWEDSELSVEDLLEANPDARADFAAACYAQLGLDEDTARSMAGQAVSYAGSGSSGVFAAVVQILCEKVSFVSCFLLAFLLIIILLTVIGNLPNLSYKLPHLDTVNDAGGVVLGVVTGLMFCAVLVWALKFTGMLIGRETLSSAWLAGIFLRHNFVTNYLSL